MIWSDHGTNFVGAAKELKDLYSYLKNSQVELAINKYCSDQDIQWTHIPEHAPHFGGLWEAAVKSIKRHFRRIIGNVRLTFEELATVLAQVEACLNSRPLTPLPQLKDGMEVLTPGHFLIGSESSRRFRVITAYIAVATLASMPSRYSSPVARLVSGIPDQPLNIFQVDTFIT